MRDFSQRDVSAQKSSKSAIKPDNVTPPILNKFRRCLALTVTARLSSFCS